MAGLIDFAFFDEIQRECGDQQLFRLPETIPELPAALHGSVMPARRLKRLAENAIGLLSAAVNDREAAENESAMAGNRHLSSAERWRHNDRSFMFRQQAERREVLAYAKIIAVSDAVMI